jgi:hypothetical protein
MMVTLFKFNSELRWHPLAHHNDHDCQGGIG